MCGHSGATHLLPLVAFGRPPRNRQERLAVVRRMVDHAASCVSGDNTLAAAARAVRDVKGVEADDYFVFLVSDANLEGYGVTSASLAAALMADRRVNSYVIAACRSYAPAHFFPNARVPWGTIRAC